MQLALAEAAAVAAIKTNKMSRSLLFLAITLALALALAGAGQLARKERASPKGVYEEKCSKCHRLYEPKDYSEEEWQLWMTNMSQKAKLTVEQERLINGYLDVYRGGNKP